MSKYTVRVELHDASWEDYVELYEHMSVQGFSDVIQSDNGTKYKMPPAEYNHEGTTSGSQVLERAKSAAVKTGRRYAVLVTESTSRTWEGLKRV